MKREALPSATAMSRDSVDRFVRACYSTFPDASIQMVLEMFCVQFEYLLSGDIQKIFRSYEEVYPDAQHVAKYRSWCS